MAKGNLLSTLRKLTLLFVLIAVALGSYLSRVRSTDWIEPLWVTIYPINGDNSPVSQQYIEDLEQTDFAAIEDFIRRESGRYNLDNENPVFMKLRNPIVSRPPEPPEQRQVLSIMWWSLKLRLWANRAQSTDSKPKGDIRIFVLYYDPDTSPTLKHSLGLQKGLIGVVHAFAKSSLNPQNNVVIAHEMLHTLGASDKYGGSNYPAYPDGFAQPNKTPLLPQTKAEIMGGRIPITEEHADIPPGLRQVLVGEATAREINWVQ